MNAATAEKVTKTLVSVNIAQVLKDAGVDVVAFDFGRMGDGTHYRADVRGKKSATLAKDMLTQAGLSNVRTLHEGKGLWLVVGMKLNTTDSLVRGLERQQRSVAAWLDAEAE